MEALQNVYKYPPTQLLRINCIVALYTQDCNAKSTRRGVILEEPPKEDYPGLSGKQEGARKFERMAH